MGRSKTRTVLLVSILVIMVFGVFIVLPMLVPSYGDTNCNAVIMGCNNAQEPIRYTTLIWNKDKWPLSPDKRRYELPLYGRFNVEPVSENSSTIRVFGYLLYGSITYHENDSNDDIEDLFNVFPTFRFLGGLRDKPLIVVFTQEYQIEAVIDDPFIITTGSNGWFEFELDTDDKAECYRITITYPGETIVPKTRGRPVEIYFGKIAQNSNCPGLPDTEREENRFWLWIGIGFGIIAITLASIIFLRYRKRRHIRTARPILKSGSVPPPIELESNTMSTGPETPLETGGDTDRIRLSFPDIEPELPAVWGMERELMLAVEVVVPDGETGKMGEIRIDWGDGGEENDFTESHQYLRNGEYRITVSYRRVRKRLSSWRVIRIVDYREEMVRVFAELVTGLGLADISITPETTPRELEKMLVERLGRSYRSVIRDVVDGFEEANYSTHPVNRERYVTMLRGIWTILRK